ncbi:hypothetical protein EDD11_000957 [Mortierella claussenii]|nr:hypothetical protein EDD11_000957 [Mortierella claussenii]
MAPQPHPFPPASPHDPQLASSPPMQQHHAYQTHQQQIQQHQQQQQQQQSVPSQLSILQRQQQEQQLRLEQFQQEHQRQQQLASMGANSVLFNNNQNQNNTTPQQQQQQQQHQQAYNAYPAKQNWDILTGPNAIDNPMALHIGPDGSLMAPRWDAYDLSNLPPVQIAPRAKNISVIPRTPVDYATAQHHPSLIMQRQNYIQSQQPQQHQHQSQQQQHNLHLGAQDAAQHQQYQQQQLNTNGQYLFSPSPVTTLSASAMTAVSPQQQQQNMSTSPVTIPEYLKTSCSPEMPIKASPVEQQLSWASWEETISHNDDSYATPAHTHTSFDESSREEAEPAGTKRLKVFTSSKKDDDGEFRKGQQFYLNIQLNAEDRERYRFLRIPTENIVLPCRADSTGRIGLNTSGKRSAQSMSMPTSAQEEDVLALKLTTYLEPEHRVVVPCGRCKDKTSEILRFHPGVNGKPMIDENGMVSLRDGHVKLIASAWCASTSHHRGPGTKFSFQVELSSMTHHQTEPSLIYDGRSDEVEIYASHGRDKGTRIANKNLEKASKSHSPSFHDRGHTGPPSPAKTTASSPPSSPSTAMSQYESGPAKKRREDPPLTPPMVDSDMPPTIKSLEPRKGPICRENHVIIIGSNFSRGMTPMFGREYGTVIDINPFYIECTTPRYPITETVNLWIYHNATYLPTDKTYEFTDEQAQSDMEQLLRNLIQDGEGGDAGSYLSLLERIAGLPPSTDISSQTQSNGSTMLHNSVLLGYQMGVNLLIEEGIELDIEDDSGLTALDYAIFTNNVEITDVLLQAGSMVSIERLQMLTLTPTTEMLALLRDLCDIDLSELSAQFGTRASSSTPAEVYNESSVGALIEDTILEDTETQFDQPMPLPTFSSIASEQHRAMPLRATRPLSIATVSTQSTGMMSLAPTMSTMALSATSSTQSRSTVPGLGGRAVNAGPKGGLENIWQCAKKGNLALVRHHLEKDPGLINTPWKFDGRSVLSSACASSQPQELVEFLVQRGAQVNSADTFYKRTALHTLCEEAGLSQDDWRVVIMSQADQDANERDVLATMRFLLDNGAVVDAKNHWKETPLMRLFAGRDCVLMVQELYSRGADSRLKSSKDAYPHGTALCYAAFYGRIQSLKWMLENDLLINDEANVKDAIRWAKSSRGSSSGSGDTASLQAGASGIMQNANMVRRKEERKAEAIRLLEGWLGDAGSSKRKALAKDVSLQNGEDWWRRMSGIVHEDGQKMSEVVNEAAPLTGGSLAVPAGSKVQMPSGMMPLWREVQGLSESLVGSSGSTSSLPELATSPASRLKWNPLTILRK